MLVPDRKSIKQDSAIEPTIYQQKPPYAISKKAKSNFTEYSASDTTRHF